ncbi:uncharacterized protein [Antedon mediterranea]
MEVCGTTLDVTLAATAFDEIIHQVDDKVTMEHNKTHEDILDSHLNSFAQDEEWQGLDVETSMNYTSHVKRAILSVLSEGPLDEHENSPLKNKKCTDVGEVFHSLDSSSDEEGTRGFNASVVCSTVKKNQRPSSMASSSIARHPQHPFLDGSYLEDQNSVIFLGMKNAPNSQLDETIIGGNVMMSPKTKKMRLDTIDTIVLDSTTDEDQDDQDDLVKVLMDVGYEQWAIEAAQATLPEDEKTNHKKILGILQSQKNENKLKSLTLPSNVNKIRKEISKNLIPAQEQQDLSSLSIAELQKKQQLLISMVSNRPSKSLVTPLKLKSETFGSPSLPQSTPLIKFDAHVSNTESEFDDLDHTVVDAGMKKTGVDPLEDLRCHTKDVEYIGELKMEGKPFKEDVKPADDWIYVSSSSSESSGERDQKIKVKSEKSFVNAIENELVARQKTTLLTQKAQLEEEMKKQQDDIMKELEKRYEEQNRQLRLENERLQRQQEESIKELRQMMENQNKKQLMKDEQLKKELSKKEKDKEIKQLEEQTKRMQKALKEQEETMKQLQRQQQTLANVKTQNLPIESPIRIEPKPSGVSSGLRPIVIDGSNVAMAHGKNKVFSCRGIALCVKYFQDLGHKEITVFLPHWRKTQEASRDKPITDRRILDDLERKEILHFTPSRKVKGRFITSYDDRFIVRLASMNDGVIVSNDNYRDLMGESEKWKRVIEERLLMYNIVGDHFLVPDDPLGRNGPSLQDFLRKQPLNSNEPTVLPPSEPRHVLPQHAIQPAVPKLLAKPVRWNMYTREQHFPELRPSPQLPEQFAPIGIDEWRMNAGQSIRHSVQQPSHVHTEPWNFRPPDTYHRQLPQQKDYKKDTGRRKQNKNLTGTDDMEELTRVFEKLVRVFPNQEEKIMTVLHDFPDVKDIKKYESMIRNPSLIDVPEKKMQDVRTLPMYSKLKSVFPDSETKIIALLTKYPQVDDMNALCGMLLE